MPPRKRTTRINTRAKPKSPKGDEGKSLTERERKCKLEFFLKDFDTQVEQSLKTMETKMEQFISRVTVSIKGELMQLPHNVREMTVNDFIAVGGTVQTAMENLEQENKFPETDPLYQPCPMSSKLVKAISKTYPNLLSETIIEENETGSTMRTTRRAGGRTLTANKGRNMQEPSSVYRPSTLLNSSLKTRYRTPAQRMATTCWDTPLITPKFDPKLPYTPFGTRDPRPGERLMSITGSPVSNPADSRVSSSNPVDSNITVDSNGLFLRINDFNNMDDINIDIPKDYMKKVLSVFANIKQKMK